MKHAVLLLLAIMLTACNPSEPPAPEATDTANIPSVEELAADPDRLRELRQQCKTDRPKEAKLTNSIDNDTKTVSSDQELPSQPLPEHD